MLRNIGNWSPDIGSNSRYWKTPNKTQMACVLYCHICLRYDVFKSGMYAPELSWQAVIAGAEHAKNQYSNHLGPISLSPRWVKPLIKMIYYISGACEKVHRGMKMADVEEVLMDFLKHCPHKKGGPKFKVLSTQTQNVYWSPKMMFF